MYVMYNAAERATPPKAEKTKPDYYQPEVLNKIIRALDDAPTKWKCITYILIDTGCRRGEVMGLKWESLDLKNNIITIERALLYTPETGVFEGPPKNGMSRTIRIAPETVAMLLNWKYDICFMALDRNSRGLLFFYLVHRMDVKPLSLIS
jgi:integrase